MQNHHEYLQGTDEVLTYKNMTKDEASKIFEAWQAHIKIFDKFTKIFSVIPESFLPYRVEVLEKALNIIAEDYYTSGNLQAAENIKALWTLHVMGLYMSPGHEKMNDEFALRKMNEDLDFMFENENFLNLKLGLLADSAKS